MASEPELPALPLPAQRGLTRQQAAQYLGIGVTLLTEIGPLPIKIGRRCVYDRLDLDRWLEDYKVRGRASKEVLWPKNLDSTDVKIRRTGGSKSRYPMDAEYAKALGYET